MATIKIFEDLEIWQKGREICKGVWVIMEETTLAKDYGLKNQMNTSSGSVMDNIAEGFERNGNREFIQFLSISKASCGELRSQLYRAYDRKHINDQQFNILKELTETESKMIGSFITYLINSENKGSKFKK